MLAPVAPASLVAAALLLNLHYPFLGRPVLEGLLTSRPVLGLGNAAFGLGVTQLMRKQGVPQPDRCERYSSSGVVDIYEPIEGSASPDVPRTAVLYFHSGAFIGGHRSMGAGMCGWLASHGAVCLSASYRRTGSGAGVSGCIEDAWTMFRWLREPSNAARLNIDPSQIVVAGDSAGGLLAAALATGLDPASSSPVGGTELPAALIGGWPVTALGSLTYAPRRAMDGRWEETPAGKEFRVANAFVPVDEHGHSAEATQARLKTVFASGFLCWGRRAFGLLPAAKKFPDDDAISVSPLRLADRVGLPPMLLLTGSADQIVPCEQTSRFAEVAQDAGNEVAHLIFEGAVHGGGGVNSAAGRAAALAFLRHHGLIDSPVADDDTRDAIGGAMRAFSLEPVEYEPVQFQPALDGRSTLHLKPLDSDSTDRERSGLGGGEL